MALATRKRKKAVRARRKTTGAGAAPLDDYKRAKDFFHFEVDRKEYLPIIKAYVKKNYDKATQQAIFKNNDGAIAYAMYLLDEDTKVLFKMYLRSDAFKMQSKDSWTAKNQHNYAMETAVVRLALASDRLVR